MSGGKPLAIERDIRYVYDGSLPGLYCCVYECVYNKELPSAIITPGEEQTSLLLEKRIATDEVRADRVRASIPAKMSDEALKLVEAVYFSCLEDKELAILKFLLLGYREGAQVTRMLGHPDVNVMIKAHTHIIGEQHLLRGFVRFADYGGTLAAVISPKNFVLPFLAKHFVMRYSEESFVIYDKTHGAALICDKGKARIVPVESLELDDPGEEEMRYQSLWKRFYDTIAIKERINPKCRMTHMPKRYWANMLEVRDLL